jgi:hypothetical protein
MVQLKLEFVVNSTPVEQVKELDRKSTAKLSSEAAANQASWIGLESTLLSSFENQTIFL